MFSFSAVLLSTPFASATFVFGDHVSQLNGGKLCGNTVSYTHLDVYKRQINLVDDDKI